MASIFILPREKDRVFDKETLFETMPTNLHHVRTYRPTNQAEMKAGVVIASLWLAVYLVILGVTIASPILPLAIEFASRY